MKKNHLHKSFVDFLIKKHSPKNLGEQEFHDQEIPPEKVIEHLLEEYKNVKTEYENLLKR
jgi:hypothetical protein